LERLAFLTLDLVDFGELRGKVPKRCWIGIYPSKLFFTRYLLPQALHKTGFEDGPRRQQQDAPMPQWSQGPPIPEAGIAQG